MAGVAVVHVSVEPVDYQFGGWCNTCLLPTGVRILAMITIGPSAHLRTFDRCTEFPVTHLDVDPPDAPDVDHL